MKYSWECNVCVLSCSVVSDSETPWTAAHQAPLPVGILQAGILERVAMPQSQPVLFRGKPQTQETKSCLILILPWNNGEETYIFSKLMSGPPALCKMAFLLYQQKRRHPAMTCDRRAFFEQL